MSGDEGNGNGVVNDDVRTVQVFHQFEQQRIARNCIDYAKIHSYLSEYRIRNPLVALDMAFLHAVTKWFKQDAFHWVNIVCTTCRQQHGDNYIKHIESIGVTDQFLPSEGIGWPSRVELYKCTDCQQVIRYPRYSTVCYI